MSSTVWCGLCVQCQLYEESFPFILNLGSTAFLWFVVFVVGDGEHSIAVHPPLCFFYFCILLFITISVYFSSLFLKFIYWPIFDYTPCSFGFSLTILTWNS